MKCSPAVGAAAVAPVIKAQIAQVLVTLIIGIGMTVVGISVVALIFQLHAHGQRHVVIRRFGKAPNIGLGNGSGEEAVFSVGSGCAPGGDIEIGEIESAISKFEAIKDVAVVVRKIKNNQR